MLWPCAYPPCSRPAGLPQPSPLPCATRHRAARSVLGAELGAAVSLCSLHFLLLGIATILAIKTCCSSQSGRRRRDTPCAFCAGDRRGGDREFPVVTRGHTSLAQLSSPRLNARTGERGFASLIFLPSAFLVSVSSDRRYEEALSDYQMALAHLRENPFIDYKQLGLRHVLYAWEVRGRQRGSAARSSAGGIFRSPAEGARNPRAFQDSTGQQQNNSARAVRAFFKRNLIIKVTEQRHL